MPLERGVVTLDSRTNHKSFPGTLFTNYSLATAPIFIPDTESEEFRLFGSICQVIINTGECILANGMRKSEVLELITALSDALKGVPSTIQLHNELARPGSKEDEWLVPTMDIKFEDMTKKK